MNTHKRTARLVGALFLTAMAASLLGAGLVDAIPIIGVGIAMYLIFVVAPGAV